MPKKLVRVAAVGLGVLLVLGLAAYLGLQAYLGSESARKLVSDKLSERFGGDVRITRLSSGASTTTVGIEVRGPDTTGAPEDPLLAGTVTVDAGPIGLATGASPDAVTVDAATFTLHLDAAGNLKTPFPKPKSTGGGGKLPDIRVTNATARIVQAGRPEFRVGGVDLTITDAGGTLKISAKANDPTYGAWIATGEWAATGDTGSVTASTNGSVRLTPDKLKSIPFVPAETWETVEMDGTSPVTVTIGREAGDKWTWRVECAPTGTRVKVAPVGNLVVTDAAGKIVVDMSKVTLTGFTGKTADGTVKLDSVMDFGPTPSKLSFTVDAANLDIKQTPPNWKLADRMTAGRLSGKGSVTLLVAGGKAKVAETAGEAAIVGKLFGGDAEIKVRPEVDGDELRFSDAPSPKAAHTPAAPPTDPATAALLRTLLAVMIQPPAAPATPAAKAPETVRANLRLRDVDIAELLKSAKVTTPVKIAGKVSLTVVADIPTGSPGTVKLYRATGNVSVPALQIEGLTLNNVTADAELKDGVLTLTKLAASFPADAGAKPPGFAGSARFGIDPRGELAADLVLDRVPMGQVFAAVPGLAGKAAGSLSGTFDVKAPGDKLGDLAGYVANGKLTSDSLTLYGQKIDKLAIELALRAGVATLAKADADVYGGTVRGAGKVPLVGAAGGDFKVTFANIDAGAATKAIPDSPVNLQGVVGGTFTGVLPPVRNFDASKLQGDLDLNAPRLVVQGFPATKLQGKVGYKPGVIAYDLKGDALGGNFDVNGEYPLGTPAPKPPAGAPAPKSGGTVKFTGLRLERLARELNTPSLAPLRGVAELTFNYTFDADGRPTGTGRVAVAGASWGNSASRSTIAAPVRLTADGVTVPDVTGSFAGGTLRGRAEYPFDRTRRRSANVTLDNADVAALLAPFGVAADGRASVTLRTRLGSEVRGSGTVTVSRARVEGIDVADLRVPLTWAYSTGAGAQVTSRDIGGTVAGGRVTGRAEAVVRGTARVDARVEFVALNVGALSPTAGGYGLGKATGRLDLNGGAVRGLNDLNGTLTATIGETSARELPLIGGATNLLSPGQSLTRFDTGDLVARLGGGLVRVERLALAGRGARLFADGTVGLATGRLDLDVVYNTGQVGAGAPGLRAIARNIPAIGPIPVGLIVRVSEALSNRVVRLKVGGTIQSPVYQLNAARLLTENAVRFLVGSYVPEVVTGR